VADCICAKRDALGAQAIIAPLGGPWTCKRATRLPRPRGAPTRLGRRWPPRLARAASSSCYARTPGVNDISKPQTKSPLYISAVSLLWRLASES
jgi:hypothetical protein